MAMKSIGRAWTLLESLKFGGPTQSSIYRAFSSLQSSAVVASRGDEDVPDVDWDRLGFGLVPTDFMYIMKCSASESFSKGEVVQYGNIELSPSAGVLNYGQGLFEGLKAYHKEDGHLLLFRPNENALRMSMGAERLCMPSPSVSQFVDAVKQTVRANRRWVPPYGKGALYIRPLLMGTGGLLGLAPAPEYTFLVYACPVGNYFQEGLAPINLFIHESVHRATPGGTGGVKSITNYAPVLKVISEAKSKGFSDVLYLDSINKRYLEEVSSCNIFVVKGNTLSTPPIDGTILPGITRKSIVTVARNLGYQVQECPIPVDELIDADEVFCTGTAVVVASVGSITHLGERVVFNNEQPGPISRKLYTALTDIQMGRAEDQMGWTVAVD